MRRFLRWLCTDSSEAYSAPRDLPDLKTRVERGIESLLTALHTDQN